MTSMGKFGIAAVWWALAAVTGNAAPVLVDQIGYRPGDTKVAFSTKAATSFQLWDAATKQPVFQGDCSPGVLDPNSEETLTVLDFTAWRTPGEYVLAVDGGEPSAPFAIGDEVYRGLLTASLDMLAYQRCGTELSSSLDQDFYHGVCHTGEAEIFGTNRTVTADGGWHDAGDYGKYVVPGAISVGHLLLAWELWPGSLGPSVLAEARWELEWLLRMQDPAKGGVYHKLTSRNFTGMDVSPDYDLTSLVVSPVSYTATADFGAVMAMASRIWKTLDPGFSARCLQAAKRAAEWVQRNPFVPFRNPPGILTGEYGDGNGSDEALWMTVELLRATGESRYAVPVRQAAASGIRADAFGWADTGMFSLTGMALASPEVLDSDSRKAALKALTDRASALASRSASAPDRTMMQEGDFHWGSNMTLLDQAMVIVTAHRLAPDAQTESAALENLHYLLGRNVLGLSFVTGFGTKSVQNPHHRPSLAAGVFRPVPGMVSGGPNSRLEDPSARAELQGLPPAKSFLDDSGSYSTNEVAIYWNTPLTFVLAALNRP